MEVFEEVINGCDDDGEAARVSDIASERPLLGADLDLAGGAFDFDGEKSATPAANNVRDAIPCPLVAMFAESVRGIAPSHTARLLVDPLKQEALKF